MPIQRIAFTMRLKKGQEREYEKRHAEIWPELEKVQRELGIRDYSIYLDKTTSVLFAVLKTDDVKALDTLSRSAVVRKWWDYMSDILEVNEDRSPRIGELREVYRME